MARDQASENSRKRKRTEDHEEEENQVTSFHELKEYFDAKFEAINNKFIDETQNLAKKLKKPVSSSFKYKGNKFQYDFNNELIENLEELLQLIEVGSITRSTNLANKMLSSLTKRNKLIKIADRSPAGWGTVAEYISDDLASDSEDDKRIKSAETKAMKKLKIKVPTVDRSASQSYLSSLSSFRGKESNQTRTNNFRANFRPVKYADQNENQGRYSEYNKEKRQGTCFGCGKPGHYRHECIYKR